MSKRRTRNIEPKKTRTTAPPTALFAFILGCFLVSGLTGLTYEILWTRLIVEIIGSSPFAVSIVLTVFMAGLGVGAYAAGRIIDRVKEPRRLVRIYGILELSVGAYGLLLPVLLEFFKPVSAVVYNRLFDHTLAYHLITFVGCGLVLIIPVTCMGATLPILSRFFVTSLSRVSTHVGRLYGLNTIGAALGSVLSGFWLINLLGVQGTLLVAVLSNALIGAACILAGARMQRGAASPEGAGAPAGWSAATEAEAATGTPARPRSVPDALAGGGDRLRTYALVIFAVSGFCAMAYEVIWIRLLALIVGPTTYSLTIVLVTFITGLALGAMFFGWAGDRTKHTMTLLLATQIVAALSALWFSQVIGNSQFFFAKLISRFKDNFAHLYLVKAGVLFAVMFLPTFCSGATFPLVGKIYTTSLARTGRSIGYAYAANSVGAVLGSFCAGFVLIPFVGKENGLSIAIALQLLTALFVSVRVFGRAGIPLLRWAPLAVFAGLAAVLTLIYPQWDRKALSKGRYHRLERFDLDDIGWVESLSPRAAQVADKSEEELVYYGDGIGGFTTVMKQDQFGVPSYSLLNTGKADASYPGDMPTQTLFAHLPMIFHPRARDVLVIGLASGITAGEMLHYPVERLDIVDINEQVVAASEYFREWNGDVLADSRTRLIIQDGRAHLAMSDRKYDVISSEPSNPWMAGLASLFTREFFELARDRLNDGGIFVQFTHAYAMDWNTFAMIGRTFARVFPNAVMANTDPSTSGADYLLIGIKGDGRLNESVAARNLQYAQRSKNVVLRDHRLFYNLILSEDLGGLFGDGPIHTENRPYLEFAAPKLLYTTDLAIQQMIAQRKWLSEETRAILRDITTDLDTRIDFVEYALSVHGHAFAFENRVNLSAATAEQKERFANLLIDYCEKNVVQDVFSLKDRELWERCVRAQVRGLKTRMAEAEDRARFINRIGRICSNAGELDQAAGYFTEVLSIEPDDVEAHNNLANVLARQKKYEDAIRHHERAIELVPDNAKLHNNLGCTLLEQGRNIEALEHFYKALELEPRFADVHYNLGKLFASQRELDRAIDHFNMAVRINPGYAEAHNDLAVALIKKGSLDDAIRHYRAALRVNPDLAVAHGGLGDALIRQGKTEQAVEHLSKAVQLEPNQVTALNNLAWTLATDRDPRFRNGQKAVELAERACALTDNEHPLFLDTLAAAYAESGDFDKAEETARRALALARSAGQGQAEWALEIEKRLALYSRGQSFRTGS
jgi:spermidine synthase